MIENVVRSDERLRAEAADAGPDTVPVDEAPPLHAQTAQAQQASAPLPVRPVPQTAGELLKAARLARGMHVGVLAANIKVAQRKIEALEADRYDELPDATFTRALAQTLCRVFKINPEPVLALLPKVNQRGLGRVDAGLNAPFRERPGRLHDSPDGALWQRPMVWVTALAVVASVVIYFAPAQWWQRASTLPAAVVVSGTSPAVPAALPAASAPASSADGVWPPDGGATVAALQAVVPVVSASTASAVSASASSGASSAASSVVTSVAVAVAAPSAAVTATRPAAASAVAITAVAAKGSEVFHVQAQGDTWVDVRDAQGRILVSRLLRKGEASDFTGVPPLQVKIGHAAVTQVLWRGKPYALPVSGVDKVARFELR